MTNPLGAIPVEHWADLLNSSVSIEHQFWNRVTVLPQVDSTQDEARRMHARVGDVIVAGHQTNGRGRLGRAWNDTGDSGVAVTFVLERSPPERLAIASGRATAEAVRTAMLVIDSERSTGFKVGIKWPNDVMVGGRKIAGVLIEQFQNLALVGVGINVRQLAWPGELQGRAVSLLELGFDCARPALIDLLLQSMWFAMRESDQQLRATFPDWDVLIDTTAAFRVGEREVRGKVLRVDPMKGLAVLTDNEGEVWLPAATTSVIRE